MMRLAISLLIALDACHLTACAVQQDLLDRKAEQYVCTAELFCEKETAGALETNQCAGDAEQAEDRALEVCDDLGAEVCGGRYWRCAITCSQTLAVCL